MDNFDEKQANDYLKAYQNDGKDKSLENYLSDLKVSFDSIKFDVSSFKLFKSFILNVISCPTMNERDNVATSALTLAEIHRRKAGSSDFYIECLTKYINADGKLNKAKCIEILDSALKTAIYEDAIRAIACNLKEHKNDKGSFELLYVCCKTINSCKFELIGGKTKYQVGYSFLNEVEESGYNIPRLTGFRHPFMTLRLHSFEKKCNTEGISR